MRTRDGRDRDGRRNFVLVTGMPRSGTTAIGSALASGPRSAYYYEPLNRLSGLRSVHDWFVFPDGDGASEDVDTLLEHVFALDVRLKAGLWDADPGWRRAIKLVTGSRSRVSALRCRFDPSLRTIIWKDPFASFLVPRLHEHGVPVVVTVRAPEASAASFKRLGWGFDLERIQRKLAELTPGADYLEVDVSRANSPALNGAVLWRLLYGFIDAVSPTSAGQEGVVWANSRSLIADPMTAYDRLFAAVGLPFDTRSRRYVELEHQDLGRTEPHAKRAHDRRRNVNAVNSYWTRTLDGHELEQVRELVGDVGARIEARAGVL